MTSCKFPFRPWIVWLTSSFNCQMGRGRTTTGMIAASLIATIQRPDALALADSGADDIEQDDGTSPESVQFANGGSTASLEWVID